MGVRKSGCCAFIVAALLASPGAVLAHPHSFIGLTTTMVVQGDTLTGLKMRWVMDEITSADLLYDAGRAKAGDEVWKKLAVEVMANVLAQHYFTELWHNDKRVKFSATPQDYQLSREEHNAVLTFVLPLAKPQPLAGQSYRFSTFDPTYYVDMFYENDADVALPKALQSRCRVAVKTPKPGDEVLAFAQSLDKADAPPEDMNLGKQFAQEVTLSCQ